MSRVTLLGIQVDCMTMSDLNAAVVRSVNENTRSIIANHNTHSVYLFHHDSRMRRLYESAEWIHVDGMPLVLLARLLGIGVQRQHRVTYVDWVRPLMSLAEQHEFRVFYLGSRPGVAARAADVLRAQFPRLQLQTHDGYFRAVLADAENQEVVAKINDFAPDILMVGMGMPRQEHWLLDNHTRLNAKVMLTAGACMDYVAGTARMPPRWMGAVGLEWLYRLGTEPWRLWRRYLLEPWFVLGIFLREVWRRPKERAR